tara:strand:- start:5928 stop:6431 length:504 start_codon:yes stop_codon:yes gene_type:complete
MKHSATRGFTLIELLVVIAIIGLLSSTVLASMSSARSKARDAKRKSDLRSAQTALELYYSDYGTYQVANAGYNNGGNGWFARDTGSYGLSVSQALYNGGYISTGRVEDPIQDPGYMIYLCDGGQRYSLSATLENPSAEDIAYIQTTCNGIGGNGTYTRYGKNYAVGF